MFVSFDEFPESTLSKELTMCFTAGTNGEKVPQYITDAREKHAAAVSSLKHTANMFADAEPKKRLHGSVNKRLEQERKWVKHFDTCIAEHKKGLIVDKLKKELEKAKQDLVKETKALKDKHEAAKEEVRKACRITFREEWDREAAQKAANLKKEKEEAVAKKKAKKAGFWTWLSSPWTKKPDKQDKKPVQGMTLKQILDAGKGMDDEARRKFYAQKVAERKATAAAK
jgi:hypothetical protein